MDKNINPTDDKSDLDLVDSAIAASTKGINELRRAMQSISQDLNKAERRLAFLVFAMNELRNRIETKNIQGDL